MKFIRQLLFSCIKNAALDTDSIINEKIHGLYQKWRMKEKDIKWRRKS